MCFCFRKIDKFREYMAHAYSIDYIRVTGNNEVLQNKFYRYFLHLVWFKNNVAKVWSKIFKESQ